MRGSSRIGGYLAAALAIALLIGLLTLVDHITQEIDTISQIVANTEESELKTVLNRYLEVIDNG